MSCIIANRRHLKLKRIFSKKHLLYFILDYCMNKLLLVIILLSSSGLLYGCSDATDDQYLVSAQEYIDTGNMKSASIELKNALQKNPDNPKARLLLGKYHLEMGNMAAAEKELTKARELGVGDELILPLMSRALLFQGKNNEVQNLPLNNLTAKGQVEVLAAQSQAKLAQGKIAEAAILIEQAISKDQESIYTLIASAKIHAAKQELDLAREKLDAALLIDRKSASVWSLLGDLAFQEKNLDSAEEAYSNAIEYGVNNLPDYYKRSLVRIQLNKLKEAQQDVDRIKKRFPQSAGAYYVQGIIFYQNKNFGDAINSFQIALSDEDRFPLALLYMGASHFLQNNLAQAENYANRFVYTAPTNITGRKLLAMIKFKNQEYAEAEDLIRPAIDARKDDIGALNLLSGALIKQGKMDEAVDVLTKVAALRPDSPEAQMRLGAGLMAGGELDSGVGPLETAIQLKPDDMQANILLIVNYLQKKDYDEAIKAANTFREQNPESAVPYNLLGKVYLAANQEKEAQEAFFKALELAPGNPYASQALATLALKDKDFDKARGYYQEVLIYHENHLPTLLNLAIIDALATDEKSMVGNLQQAIKAHPKAIKPRLVLSRYYLSRGDPEKAFFLVNELDEMQKISPAVLNVIAMSYLAQNEYAEARATLEKLLAIQPNSANAHLLLAKAHAGLKDRERTKAELQKTVELAPNNLLARIALARLLLLERNKVGVKEQLNVLKKLAPENSDVLQIEASMARLNQNPNEALRLTEKAFEKTPTTTNMRILARQKWGMGNREGAQHLQEVWVKKHPEDLVARMALANSYAASNQVDMAVEQYSLVLDRNGNNIMALNNLAWYLRDTKPVQALEYARRALKIEPESAALIDTLAVVLSKNGETEKAQRTIARALVKAPGNLAMRYHSAMIDASAGDKISAIKTLKALLEEGKEFPEKEEAIKLLAQLES
ncbi:MAG TPA: PEP-CTERM system TPR-repeat protein PrsT [Nitrospirae bacterium]|nr:PEP-CTERM system TPR-repeat protein PrsT [Nitrospirota bacterium]